MKKYDVYGIGNALLDIEVNVSDEFLHENGIEKGLMTLINQGRQETLTGLIMSGKMIRRHCGGSAANTIISISDLGGQSYYSCKVARDESGDFYYKDLVDSGVDTNMKSDSRPEGTTGLSMIFVTPDAQRSMNTYLGITETLSVAEVDKEAIEKSKYVYIEGYLASSPTGKVAAIEARKIAEKSGVRVALTLSDMNMITYFGDGLMEMAGDNVELLFCNEGESLAFTKSNTLEEACEEMKKHAKTFAITLGDKGAYVFDGNEGFRIETEKVKALNSTGAGDLFAGSFLYALTNGFSYQDAGKLACAAATELVTRFGSRLPKDRLQELRDELL